jgi:hypothetical protein
MAVGEKHEETNLIVVAGENPEFVGKFCQKPNDLAIPQIATCVVNRLTLANLNSQRVQRLLCSEVA